MILSEFFWCYLQCMKINAAEFPNVKNLIPQKIIFFLIKTIFYIDRFVMHIVKDVTLMTSLHPW